MLIGKYQLAHMPGFWDSPISYSAYDPGRDDSSSLAPFPARANPRALGHPALLYFNVDWCPHCRATKPTMEQVAATVGGVVRVYSVDGDERTDLCQALGVQGFPTIVFASPDGSMYEYSGPRTVDAISSFVCQNSGRHHQFCRRQRY